MFEDLIKQLQSLNSRKISIPIEEDENDGLGALNNVGYMHNNIAV